MDNDRKLAWTIFISLGCHVLILFLATEYAPWKILKAGKKSPLVIHLNDLSSEKRTEQYSRIKQRQIKKVKRAIVPIQDEVKKVSPLEKEPVEELPTPPDELIAEEELSNQPLVRDKNIGNLLRKAQNEGSGDWQTEYTKKLRDIIKGKQRYPVMAMRNRQQGTVMVGFILRRTGELIECHITQPCQFKTLDRAALRAVRSVKRFPPFPDSVRWEQAGFIVPVSFRLEQ